MASPCPLTRVGRDEEEGLDRFATVEGAQCSRRREENPRTRVVHTLERGRGAEKGEVLLLL
jgi:hypothetical protein